MFRKRTLDVVIAAVASTGLAGAAAWAQSYPSSIFKALSVGSPQAGGLPAIDPNRGFAPLAVDVFIPSDNASQTGAPSGQWLPAAVNSTYRCCGPNVNNGRNGVNSFLYFGTPSSPSNGYKFYVAVNGYTAATVSDNGTSGGDSLTNGVFEGVTGSAYAAASATAGAPAYFGALVGGEFTVGVARYNDVKIKAALTTTEWPSDKQTGDWIDTYIWSTANGGAIGLTNWTVLDSSGGAAPLLPTGEVMRMQDSALFTTIKTGFNFTNLNITGKVMQWDNGAWWLAGNGDANLNYVRAGFMQFTVDYVVSGLPACAPAAEGVLAYVRDANASGWNAVVTGGGTLHIKVLCNGTNWVAG